MKNGPIRIEMSSFSSFFKCYGEIEFDQKYRKKSLLCLVICGFSDFLFRATLFQTKDLIVFGVEIWPFMPIIFYSIGLRLYPRSGIAVFYS